MKIISKALIAICFTTIVSTASAGTTYHVYKKGSSSTCDISTKSPDKFNKGSKWTPIASDSTRSGAKKKGKKLGCSSF